MARWCSFTMAAVILLLASACGGGGESAVTAPSETTTGSEQDFRARVSAICERLVDEAAQIPAPDTLAQLEEVVEQIKPLNERSNREFRELTPPPDLQDEYDEMLALFDEDERLLAELGEAAADRDQQRVQEVLAEYETVTAEEDRIWLELELDICTKIRLGDSSV